MFCKMRRNGLGEDGEDANPVFDKISVHRNVRHGFPVPVSCTLELIKTIFKSILVVGPVSE